MCGIAGVYLRELSEKTAKLDLNAMLDTMLDEIEHRGGDATGFVALNAEGVAEWQKAACGVDEFTKYRRPVPKGTRTILAHTRWATQGLPAFVENNHPLRRGSFFVIHNGHVTNDHKIFDLAGRKRYGRVDSECIPARLASLGKLSAAPKVMAEIEGAAAIAAVDESKPGELLLARGYNSPLYVLQTKRMVLWGSTYGTVVKTYEKHVGRLPKAGVETVKQGVCLHYVNGKLKRLSFKPYQAPKVTYSKLPNITLPYKETSTEVSNWDLDESDLTECDGCSELVTWDKLSYEEDPRTPGFTWGLCTKCIDLDWDLYEGEDPSRVNAAVLDEQLRKLLVEGDEQ